MEKRVFGLSDVGIDRGFLRGLVSASRSPVGVQVDAIFRPVSLH